jgi:hypothetical protein
MYRSAIIYPTYMVNACTILNAGGMYTVSDACFGAGPQAHLLPVRSGHNRDPIDEAEHGSPLFHEGDCSKALAMSKESCDRRATDYERGSCTRSAPNLHSSSLSHLAVGSKSHYTVFCVTASANCRDSVVVNVTNKAIISPFTLEHSIPRCVHLSHDLPASLRSHLSLFFLHSWHGGGLLLVLPSQRFSR